MLETPVDKGLRECCVDRLNRQSNLAILCYRTKGPLYRVNWTSEKRGKFFGIRCGILLPHERDL